ncbi:LLM class flavin-dependent oxidoreductase [Candidatus Nitrosocosmicus hydrocola]|uniref:LLM class flavin-dependent oxidoreductase n=1 Tax=Candidatus Nitrosocosmicus hydrocola TaxID=1826872 RepID=UPI000A8ED5E2|nr:LLM class flavin-dependent oxidoreductase [Candidatus Nitrosocosmicus hydrocola]
MQHPVTRRTLPLSVLDLVMVSANGSPAQSMRNSLDLAQHVEKWGYKRYWLAEHHNIKGIASTATSILIGFVAGGTSKIRVGSGGIMLPNHSPLIIAEQFGTLESLYPGRIELGLGRAPGTDRFTAMALRRGKLEETEDEFPNSVKELMAYFASDTANKMVRANPGEGLDIPIWLLGSSTFSAQLAADWGLPFAFASHFAPAYLESAVNIYRERFQPSKYLNQPHIMAAVNIFAANTDKEANRLFTSVQQMALGMIRRNYSLLQPPVTNMDKIWDHLEKYAVGERLKYSFVGEPNTIKQGLESFLNRIYVDELMVVSHIYDHDARLRSFELLSTL